MRHATVKMDDTTLRAKVAVNLTRMLLSPSLTPAHPPYTPTHSTPTPQLVDLPTIVECHKTIDSKTLYKTGNISQMLVCSHDPPDTAAVTNLDVHLTA